MHLVHRFRNFYETSILIRGAIRARNIQILGLVVHLSEILQTVTLTIKLTVKPDDFRTNALLNNLLLKKYVSVYHYYIRKIKAAVNKPITAAEMPIVHPKYFIFVAESIIGLKRQTARYVRLMESDVGSSIWK